MSVIRTLLIAFFFSVCFVACGSEAKDDAVTKSFIEVLDKHRDKIKDKSFQFDHFKLDFEPAGEAYRKAVLAAEDQKPEVSEEMRKDYMRALTDFNKELMSLTQEEYHADVVALISHAQGK